jgi:hypothetical protein
MPMRSLMQLSVPPPVFRSGIACCTSPARRTAFDDWKFHQHAVACGLDDATVMAGDFPIDHLGAECFELSERPFLVGSDQP